MAEKKIDTLPSEIDINIGELAGKCKIPELYTASKSTKISSKSKIVDYLNEEGILVKKTFFEEGNSEVIVASFSVVAYKFPFATTHDAIEALAGTEINLDQTKLKVVEDGKSVGFVLQGQVYDIAEAEAVEGNRSFTVHIQIPMTNTGTADSNE
ncbi:MAG: hypothetical protein N4A49_14640 [Marinifilaceae bacterium]|jgi:hypothetical protein|nr:hypothetical protein [Marinifilaceae bacterium]